jgi:hypothetical protein
VSKTKSCIAGIEGYEILKGEGKAELNRLKPVFDNWLKVLADYTKLTNDAAWWHNERANVGTLAAAAWRTENWCALEEFPTEKKVDGLTNDIKNGRCDLYITNEAISYAIEAKHCWKNVGTNAIKRVKGKDKVKDCFEEALEDAANLTTDEADIRLGACFVVPYFPKAEYKKLSDEKINKRLEEWLESIKKDNSPDACAWLFLKKEKGVEINNEKFIYPGVCLLIKARLRS